MADGFLENPSSSMHRNFKAAFWHATYQHHIERERDDDGETNAALDEEMPMLWGLWNKGPTPSRLSKSSRGPIIIHIFFFQVKIYEFWGTRAELIDAWIDIEYLVYIGR